MLKNPPAKAGDLIQVLSLGQENLLEEGMATHSSIIAWRIPQTEEPSGLQSIGSQSVIHDWSDLACIHHLYNSSVQFSHSVMSASLRPHGLQHAGTPCPSPVPGFNSNLCPLNWWYYPTISSSVIPFTSLLQSFPASGSFQMSQLFTSGG